MVLRVTTACANNLFLCRFQNGDDEVLIHLDQVNCTGKADAIHLMSCVNNDHGEHDCLHTEDVALKCSKYCIKNFTII